MLAFIAHLQWERRFSLVFFTRRSSPLGKVLRNPSFLVCKKYLAQLFIARYYLWLHTWRYRTRVYVSRRADVTACNGWNATWEHLAAHTLRDSILLPELNCASSFYAGGCLSSGRLPFLAGYADRYGRTVLQRTGGALPQLDARRKIGKTRYGDVNKTGEK